MTDPYGGMQQQDPYKQAILSQLKGGAAPPGANPVALAPPTPFYSPGSMSDPRDSEGPGGLDGHAQERAQLPNGGLQGPGLPPQAAPPAQQNANPGYVPSGWDAAKWNDPGKHDLKYDVGHLLAGVSNNGAISAADVQKVAPQLEAMGVKWDGGDGLTFPDGNHVDFIRGMKAGNGVGQLNWLDSTMQGGTPFTPPGQSTAPTIAPTLEKPIPIDDPSMTTDQSSQLWQRIMASLNNPGNAQLANTDGKMHAMASPASMLASRLNG